MTDRAQPIVTESAAGIAAKLDSIYHHSLQQQVMNDQKSNDGWRRTLILDDQYVWKEFEFSAGVHDNGPWKIEHEVLLQLNRAGLRGPASVGYDIQRDGANTKIRYCRECLAGEEIQAFSMQDMPVLGHFFADLHRAGIITNDPFVYNFIRDPDGTPVFIDYGKASLLPTNTLDFHWKRAREGTKFYRGAIDYNRDMFHQLLEHYRNRYRPSLPVRLITTVFHLLQLARRRLRDRRRQQARKG